MTRVPRPSAKIVRADPMTSIRSDVADLAIALARWAGRDDTKPQPGVTRSAGMAVDAIDSLCRDLDRLRLQLLGEIRASEDAAAVRADALLARCRQERADADASDDQGRR